MSDNYSRLFFVFGKDVTNVEKELFDQLVVKGDFVNSGSIEESSQDDILVLVGDTDNSKCEIKITLPEKVENFYMTYLGQCLSLLAKNKVYIVGKTMYDHIHKALEGEYVLFNRDPLSRSYGKTAVVHMRDEDMISGVYIDEVVLQKVSELYGY